MLATIGNIIWFILAGFWLGLEFLLAGVLCCITVVGIPLGVCCFKIAPFAFWPFGRDIVPDPNASAMSIVGNVIWFVFAGLWIALSCVIDAAGFFLSIIGIPFGFACLRIAKVALCPLGMIVVKK